MNKCVIYLCAVVLTYASGGVLGKLVSKDCLSCLCKELTNCDLDRGCSEGYCGLFAISHPFWLDAGSPKVQSHPVYSLGSSAFDACASDLECASRAIQYYMKRYERDCNNDGVIDCLDIAAIHKHGPFGCTGLHSNSSFVQSVQQCLGLSDMDSTISPVDWRSNFA